MPQRYLAGYAGEQVDSQGADPEDGDVGQYLHPVVVAQEIRVEGNTGGYGGQHRQHQEDTEHHLFRDRGHQRLVRRVRGVKVRTASHTLLISSVPKIP